jgi:uncharacterized membrane protein YczE
MNAYSNTLVLYFCLLVVAALVCAPVFSGGIIPVLIAGYFMLVSVNSISRGEKRAQKSKEKRR